MKETPKIRPVVLEWLQHDNTRALRVALEKARVTAVQQLIQTGEASEDVTVARAVERIRGIERAIGMLNGGESYGGPSVPREHLPSQE